MADVCPYLGLEDGSRQSLLLASQHHRCYVHGEPRRVGFALQQSVCLTSAHTGCPHQGRQRRFFRERVAGADGPPSVLPQQERATSVREPGLQPPPRAQREPGRRTVTLTEVAVVGLVAAIVLACAFIGYSIFYRIQIGPGMRVATAVAEEGSVAPNQILATLVPTFTPTPEQNAIESQTLVPATVTPEPMEPTATPAVPTPMPVVRLAANSPPSRLVIPEIDLDVAVIPVGVKTRGEGANAKAVWDDAPNAAAFHQTTAYPGNPGNTVINGHRDIFSAVFRHLDKVAVGNEIVLYVGEVAYPYSVTETLVVPETFASARQRAENLRLIGHMPEERLTLITCTPVGLATHRLLIIAKPAESVMPEMPEAGSEGDP